MAGNSPHLLWDIAAELGEGPVWVEREKSLYFVDIKGCAIHRWRADGDRDTWKTPAMPGFIAPCRDGRFICGMRGGLYAFDSKDGAFTFLVPVENDKPSHRINDGFVDTAGRLWFGTMHDDHQSIGGVLYSLEKKDNTLRLHDSGYVITNGPATSPDGRTFYFTDSATHTVYAFALSEAGTLSNKRPFIRFPTDVFPDGTAVDERGDLWIALYNGWRIEKYSPRGDKLGEIRFPCANVTKPAFGGDDRHTLYVTTAWQGLSSEARAQQPLAGGLFAVNLQTPGLRLAEWSND